MRTDRLWLGVFLVIAGMLFLPRTFDGGMFCMQDTFSTFPAAFHSGSVHYSMTSIVRSTVRTAMGLLPLGIVVVGLVMVLRSR